MKTKEASPQKPKAPEVKAAKAKGTQGPSEAAPKAKPLPQGARVARASLSDLSAQKRVESMRKVPKAGAPKLVGQAKNTPSKSAIADKALEAKGPSWAQGERHAGPDRWALQSRRQKDPGQNAQDAQALL